MIRTLLLALLATSLNGCVTTSVRDDSPASDLVALEANVTRSLKPRTLPNGKSYCAEDAKTEKAQDTCLIWLEGGFYGSEQDKQRALWLLKRGIARLKLARNPCRWYQLACRRSAAVLDKPIGADPLQP